MHTAVKFAILLGFSLVLSPEAQPVEKSCRTVFSELNKKQVELIAECLKQLGYKTVKEKTQKSTCVLKCVMSNLKVLNGNGSVDEGTFNDFVEHQWPHHLQQRAKDAFGPCFTITRNGTDTVDKFCKGYDPLMKCMTRSFTNLCKGAR